MKGAEAAADAWPGPAPPLMPLSSPCLGFLTCKVGVAVGPRSEAMGSRDQQRVRVYAGWTHSGAPAVPAWSSPRTSCPCSEDWEASGELQGGPGETPAVLGKG